MVSTLFTWAIAVSSSPPAQPKTDAGVHGVSMVLAVWLTALFLLGWAPLGVIWTPINAYGLFRRRKWAVTSTLI